MNRSEPIRVNRDARRTMVNPVLEKAVGTFRRTFELQPYREARDSLRGWRIIWEPFGPGSETGLFPGGPGAGWAGP
ncbi:MAG: hypothetical protein ABJZ55_05630 [Fuerstiella sp.]